MAESSVINLDPHKAAQEAKERNLHIPDVALGRIATLAAADGKQYGNMAVETDKEFEEFLEIASRADAKVLEIGAAFGSPFLMKAFEHDTPAEYTGLDIVPDQLKILARRIEELYPSKLSRLTLIGGGFPGKEVINQLQEGGYDAILASRVFHFFTEEQMVEAFRQVNRLLKPGGKLFLKVGSPYNNVIDPAYREKTENDVKSFLNSADPSKLHIPGFFENLGAIRNKSIDENTLKNLGFSERHVFFCDKEIVKFFMQSSGLKIEICDYSPVLSYPFKCDGREYVVAIAQKVDH